jgi:mono/diheme cytochrome c family protein
VRWVLTPLAALLALVGLAITAVGARGASALYARHDLPAPNLQVAASPQQIARGEHIASTLCASCHGQNAELPLKGGRNVSEETGMPLGDLYGPNITMAGVTADLSDGELFRMIRTGVNHEGRVTLMNGIGTKFLSDEDAQAVIAYLRASEGVAGEVPPYKPSLLFALLSGAGLIQVDLPDQIPAVSAPAAAASAEYGEYVVSYSGCRDCHGPNLDGVTAPPAPQGPSLRELGWSEAEFVSAIRTGVTPTGSRLNDPMPWRVFARMDDTELSAVYQYISGLGSTAQR